MRSIIAFSSLVTAVLAGVQLNPRDCSHDNCLRAFIASSANAATFCATFTTASVTATTGLPSYATQCSNLVSRVSTACSCLFTPAPSPSSSSTRASTTTTSSTTSPSPISSSTTASVPSSTSSSTSSAGGSTVSSSGSPCTCTAFSQIAPAVASCTAITLQGIAVPTNSTIDLSKLKTNSVVTFAGLTTFAFTNSSTFNPIEFGGANVTVTSAPGAIIDGNGQAYWDGQGSNGGVPKPDHFIVVNKLTAGSVVENLHIQNWPTHLFSISSCSNVIMRNLLLDNSAGDAPNAISDGLPAAHNSDGFDLSTSENFTITNNIVYNQDDCVAITSGNNVTVSNMYCSGGHGMSIGSVGGKSNNNVTNILFTNSQIVNSQNGARIKSNFNTTGFISNVTYSNIAVRNISIYGIDVQQDYLNGGPTGIPSNGVIISNLLFQNLTGTAGASAQDYYILCGSGSCSNFVFNDVAITGGGNASSCNYPPTGCPGP
ncbi:glycoside hydrolase family 28 protein [Hyaloscypha variabilis F]|uniref:endo-polygalacturonase n=1 Tax=Hyaloscypha variabilis (strain UAMH 11265 / GT02V1 / F) TaxID=1149755 RepID=A0A2J6RW31_HYAVF|nr:glycoside hydrolase family 28 protein [Hyaloscypha variabilis F]